LITDLNVKHKTTKLVEKEKKGENLWELELGNKFSGKKPKGQSTKGKRDTLNFIKMKNLHSVKEPKMMKSQATE
jgi:hypothetical protein